MQQPRPVTTIYGKIAPVRKELMLGGRRGVYYVNARGKRVYLKAAQYKELQERKRLPGMSKSVNIVTTTQPGKRRYGGVYAAASDSEMDDD